MANLASKKQISLIHVDKSRLFEEELLLAMSQKKQDLWVLRMDKMNSILGKESEAKRRSDIWAKIAFNLQEKFK